jgi:hypothetical protein
VTTWPSRNLMSLRAPSFLELACIDTGYCQGFSRQPAWQAPSFKELAASGC